MGKPSDVADVVALDALWRTGRSLGRSVYARVGEHSDDDDVFIGIFDSQTIAAYVAEMHNKVLREERR